eukprot:gb/GECH01003176.1/.p1 GENE.gb/GECH01003176.1/~~gb/GECH01003176.1/.p1  ORF type:complete len:419 (+),score=87.57 gb/GECH01003176.1/:1-1257(+)
MSTSNHPDSAHQAVAPLPLPSDPDTLGPEDFTKLKLLGRGDVGRVYLARHEASGRLFAMKVLTKEEMIRRNKVKRALTEREILATTDHPFIVSLYHSFQSKDRLYLVMEYCAGGEFFRMLQRQPNKSLTEDAVRFYAAEVLLALEYLHMMGFVYRDLKPENILIHESGHIRLTDFDLSKAAATPLTPKVVEQSSKRFFPFGLRPSRSRPEIDTRQMESFNSFVGTPEYIAPEVIAGSGHTSSVDWWTYGVLIFEMLFGRTPFRGSDQKDTFGRILNKNLRFPSEPHVSRNCKDLIKRLLAKDKERRVGHKAGAAEIKKHPFFKGINWSLIRNETPPIIPEIRHQLDTSNFRELADDDDTQEDTSYPPDDNNQDAANNPFREFATYHDAHKDAYGGEYGSRSSQGASQDPAPSPTNDEL